MGQCIAKTKKGDPCDIPTKDGELYCHIHSKKNPKKILKILSQSAIIGAILGLIGFFANIAGVLGFFKIDFGSIAGTSAPDMADEYISPDQLQEKGAYIKILEINPPPSTELISNKEYQFVVLVEYYLPGKVPLAEIDLHYTIGYSPDKGEASYLPSRLAAQEGKHTIQLAGVVKTPDILALNGNPFQVGAHIEALDIVQRKNYTVVWASETYPLLTAESISATP